MRISRISRTSLVHRVSRIGRAHRARPWRARRPGLWAVVAAATLASACARQQGPPGGPEDLRPPVVVSTSPAALALVTDLDAEIRFDFDERISERVSGGSIDEAISISPRSGDVRVKHGRSSLTLEVEGGLRPDMVYRVTLGAVVSDRFGNNITDPFELVFTTGPEPVPTTLAGEVWDRVTGRALSNAVVYAVGSDSLVHRSLSDREGIFAFRYLPGGDFTVTAFEDVNRNGEVDSTEVQGGLPTTLAVGDTMLVDIAVLEPDTTAANVTIANPLDSVTIEVVFDDFIDYEADIADVSVMLSREDGAAPAVATVYHEAAYMEYLDGVTDSLIRLDSIDAAAAAARAAEAAATLDSVEALVAAASPATADSAAADSTATESAATDSTAADSTTADPTVALPEPGAARVDTVVIPRIGAGDPRAQEAGGDPAVPDGSGSLQVAATRVPPVRLDALDGARAGPTVDGRRILPGRRLVVVLDTPLELDVEYELSVTGVVNMYGLAGGGGTALILLPSPPADTTTVDTTTMDTTAVDTLTIDTSSADTTSLDTASVDTSTVGTVGTVGTVRHAPTRLRHAPITERHAPTTVHHAPIVVRRTPTAVRRTPAGHPR